ncbi:nucleoside 2-deoxyribosyltransferase domain-containing protein [Zavarzinella formosa]|uniref:nucleoside 2-deoxyribosyltransferase domain-containing protein n=1 Tax=Zavarzinella formosa TaxID=360055 RepID=UPI000308A3D7|nr:nucleoside 2-deoxyribosyltransferase domain-containing protein [Zavarzinella formosa]
MARLLKPPTPLDLLSGEQSVFLAGSIEMGQAIDWQASMAAALDDLPVAVLNPRRDQWDSSWEQSVHHPPFRGQVEWELDALERATIIAIYFAPDTQAPISLLELGLFARSGKVIVCCPSRYWRRGNVEIVCARFGLPMVDDLPALTAAVRERILSKAG